MKKYLCFFAFFIILCISMVSYAVDDNPIIRVGLYYDTDALPSANLQVTNGRGYRFGFYDSQKNFIPLWSTDAAKITMTKDRNFCFKSGAFYEVNAPAGSKTLGAYHVEAITKYKTLKDTQTAISGLTSKGYMAFPAYIGGEYRVRIGSYASIEAANELKSKIGGVVIGNSNTCVTVYNTESGSTLFEYDGGTYSCLAVNPTQGEIPMPLTWFKGMKFYGGFQYRRNAGNITVINILPMQEYLKGVIPWEMYPNDPLEALKAQALCARTYAYYNLGKHGSDFDICASTHCQAYRGTERANETTNRAVDETRGQYVLYKGQPINAVFHSANGGATEDSENVWGGYIPYLRGKSDPYEDLATAQNGIWSYEFTPREMTSILNSKGYKAALIRNAYVEEYTKLGNVLKVTYVDINDKKWSFERERARTIMNSSALKKYTRSQRYTIKPTGSTTSSKTSEINVNGVGMINPSDGNTVVIGAHGTSLIPGGNSVVIATGKGNVTVGGSKGTVSGGNGNFIISGTGWGHNIGMSQEGAAGMAKKGFKVADIIHFYYTDVTITGE